MFKKIIYSLAAVSLLLGTSSCNDWLDIKPNNEQITDDYWKSKEDVESVVMSGYYYMRQCVPTLIKWGELRGGTFYVNNSNDAKLQDFNMTPSNSNADYEGLYKVINAANSVLKYAPEVRSLDDTYYESRMKAHLCEAYFMRAYSHLVLLKNFGEVPMVLQPYVDDTENFDIAKSTESEIVASIKADVLAALETGAAKGTYEKEWETKGRVTKWALYALMADVCLWNEDYEDCIRYTKMITEATDTFRPVFIANTNQWYEMFCYGNSNESIFELNWDYNTAQETNNFSNMWTQDPGSPMRFTNRAVEALREETAAVVARGASLEGRVGRMLLCTFIASGGNASYGNSPNYYLWKYAGTDIQDQTGGLRVHKDANFILYRVSEMLMMQAQAETMLGNIPAAIRLVNRVRVRAGLDNFQGVADEEIDGMAGSIDEQSMLEEILAQKEMEFVAEGKRWYDLLWFGRVANNRYRDSFVNMVIEGNQTTNPSWVRSVLADRNAWYLPIPQDDIDHNRLLKQNPYYKSSK